MSEKQKSCSPGPWSRRFNGASVFIDDANGRAVARATPRIRGELNGDLIAAAPELLAALELGLRNIEDIESNDQLNEHERAFADAARAAIAKARGGAA